MAISTIPAFKAALRDTLVARPALKLVQVSYGAPLPNPAREFIWLGDVESEQEWAAIGRTRREENYELRVDIMVTREGQDQQACTERCFEIAEEIADALRDDTTLGNTVILCSFGGPVKLEESASDTARGANLTVAVLAKARI